MERERKRERERGETLEMIELDSEWHIYTVN